MPRWLLLLVVRVPADPSRHRVAVWHELRRIGALSLGQGTWMVPDMPVFAEGIVKIRALTDRDGGEIVMLDAAGRAEHDDARLAEMFTAQREDEWREFVADCAKFAAEIDREIAKQKFTLAELEEEEQSLERLRRWHRTLKARDVLGAPSAVTADRELTHCAELLAGYTDLVFDALHEI